MTGLRHRYRATRARTPNVAPDCVFADIVGKALPTDPAGRTPDPAQVCAIVGVHDMPPAALRRCALPSTTRLAIQGVIFKDLP